jgi:hypothetical protein
MTSKLTVELNLIPLDRVPPPYDGMITLLQLLQFEIIDIDPDVAGFLSKHTMEGWDTILHWVTKLKWKTNHRIPGRRAHVQGAKPWGQVFHRLLDLCIHCHPLASYKGLAYPDAVIWFGSIWLEYKVIDLVYTVALAFQVQEGDKTIWVNVLRQVVRQLRNAENPYCPILFPHLHCLIDYSLQLAGQSNDFRKQCWTPYLDALGNCATQLERNPNGYHQTTFVRREQQGEETFLCVYQTCGKGKGLKLLLKKLTVSKTIALHGLQVMN